MHLLIRGVPPSPMSLTDSGDIRFPNSVIGQAVYLRRSQLASAFSQYNAGTERWFYRAGLLAATAHTVEDGGAPAAGRADERQAGAMERRGAVVVTGATSGIGRATALRLAHDGWLVFAGVRQPTAGDALAADAGAIGVGTLLLPVRLDVTDETSMAEAAGVVRAALAARGLRLAALINNAGIAVAGPIEEVPLARLREVLSINVVGAVAATQAFLPLLRRGHGRIVNISSVSGRIASPFLGPYAASKFALEAVSDALRVELAPWGVRVILIEPGPVATPIWGKGEAMVDADRAGIGEESPYAPYLGRVRAAFREGADRGIPPEEIAEVVARALISSRPRARYLISRNRGMVALMARVVPDGVRDRLWGMGRR